MICNYLDIRRKRSHGSVACESTGHLVLGTVHRYEHDKGVGFKTGKALAFSGELDFVVEGTVLQQMNAG